MPDTAWSCLRCVGAGWGSLGLGVGVRGWEAVLRSGWGLGVVGSEAG